MPIEVGIWRLGDDLQQVSFSSIESEARLEYTLAKDPSSDARRVTCFNGAAVVRPGAPAARTASSASTGN